MKFTTDRILLGVVVVLAVALAWVAAGTLEPRITNVGDKAPDFLITTDDGKAIRLDSFRGKLLVLNFWATWCAGCIEEMPSLDAFQRQFADKGLVVLTVSVDRNEKIYRRYLDREKFSFVTARDPESGISANYGTFQFPETYIIDRNGNVVEKVISNQNWLDPDFVSRVRALL